MTDPLAQDVLDPIDQEDSDVPVPLERCGLFQKIQEYVLPNAYGQPIEPARQCDARAVFNINKVLWITESLLQPGSLGLIDRCEEVLEVVYGMLHSHYDADPGEFAIWHDLMRRLDERGLEEP